MFPLGKIAVVLMLVFASIILYSCSDSVSVSNGPMDVHGTVVDAYGFNFSSARVNINDSLTIHANPDGSFSFLKVTAPYKVTVFSLKDSSMTVYDGLRTSIPVLSVESVCSEISDNHSLITLNYPAQPWGKQKVTAVISKTYAVRYSTISSTDSSVTLNVLWPHSKDVIYCDLVFLIYSISQNGEVYSFDSYASKKVNLTNNSAVVLSLTAEEMNYVPGQNNLTVNIPSGGSIALSASVVFPETRLISQLLFYTGYVYNDKQIMVPLSLPVPFSIRIEGQAFFSGGRCSYKVCVPASGEVQLQFPEPVILQFPQDDTAGVGYHTRFSYIDPHHNGIYVTSIGGNRFNLRYFTSSLEFTFPPTYMFGMSLDSNKFMQWGVTRITGYGSLDVYSSWQRFSSTTGLIQESPSEARSFTTWH